MASAMHAVLNVSAAAKVRPGISVGVECRPGRRGAPSRPARQVAPRAASSWAAAREPPSADGSWPAGAHAAIPSDSALAPGARRGPRCRPVPSRCA
jgi:hypothetical protein